MVKRLATVVLLCGSVLGSPAWAGDAAAGKAAYGVCQACHGVQGEGNAALNAPALAGQGEWYTARQLSNFRAGIRGTNPKDSYGAQMRPMAMTLAEAVPVAEVTLARANRGVIQRSASGGAGGSSGFDFIATSDAARDAERSRGGGVGVAGRAPHPPGPEIRER